MLTPWMHWEPPKRKTNMKRRNFQSLVTIFLVAAISGISASVKRTAPKEKDRREEYVKRGHSWPLTSKDYDPTSKGWIRAMQKRFDQIGAIEDIEEKWFAWQTLIGPATNIVTNYTTLGWGLTKGPTDLTTKLQHAIHQGLPFAREEKKLKGAIHGPSPLFIDDKNKEFLPLVCKTVQPILEAWTGIELIPSITYGFRLYQSVSVVNIGCAVIVGEDD